MMMMPSLNLFSPPKVTIKRRRYVSYDDTDDHDDDNETSAPANTGTVTCKYHDDLDHEYSCPRPTKRQRRRCITLVPASFTNRSRLFVPLLEDPDPETATTTCTHQEERGVPPPSLPLVVSYRQEEEEEDERREGAGRSISPSNNYLFEETPPFLQPQKKKKISRLQDVEQEEEMQQQQTDIEQEEQLQGSRCCYLDPVVYNNSKNNSNPSPLPRRKITKSTRSCSSNYLQSYPQYGSPEGTVQRQRQRQTSRRVVVPSPSPFLPSSSPFPVVEDAPGSSSTTTTTDVVFIEDTLVEHFQRATQLTEEQEELPLSTTTTTLQTSPSFDIMLRY